MHLSHKLKDQIETVLIFVLLIISVTLAFFFFNQKMAINKLGQKESLYQNLQEDFTKTSSELETLKNQDQVKRNDDLEAEITNINQAFKKTISLYVDLVDLKIKTTPPASLDTLYAQSISLLADRKYNEATGKITELENGIKEESNKIVEKQAATFVSEKVPENNTPPGSGYSRQTVSTEAGNFTVSIIAADYGSTKVIVDTASSGDCGNDCPVLPLSDYVSRNGAYAGVNGSYFCPADYPSCAGKTNTFDLLLMNKNKTYFNSDNNVYSSNPGVVFGGSYIRFLGSVSEWGRDTGIDSMISNYPLLMLGGNVTFGGDSDPKKGSKGNRSFVAQRGNTIYIGVVHSATVAESALVMKALGMDNALNLDDGGSTALWSGGYKVGPGRNLPNAVLFVSR